MVICLQYNSNKYIYDKQIINFTCTKKKFNQIKSVYEGDAENYLYTLYDKLMNEVDFFTCDKLMLF